MNVSRLASSSLFALGLFASGCSTTTPSPPATPIDVSSVSPLLSYLPADAETIGRVDAKAFRASPLYRGALEAFDVAKKLPAMKTACGFDFVDAIDEMVFAFPANKSQALFVLRTSERPEAFIRCVASTDDGAFDGVGVKTKHGRLVVEDGLVFFGSEERVASALAAGAHDPSPLALRVPRGAEAVFGFATRSISPEIDLTQGAISISPTALHVEARIEARDVATAAKLADGLRVRIAGAKTDADLAGYLARVAITSDGDEVRLRFDDDVRDPRLVTTLATQLERSQDPLLLGHGAR